VTNTPAQDGAPVENAVSLRLANGPLTAPVLSRVVTMVLARANCPIDRLDDAILVCDAISAHAPAYSRDGYLAFSVTTRGRGVELRVGELIEQGADGLVRDALVPEVGNVLEHISEELRVVKSADGSGEELVLKLSFG
jgi:hypothetical protein